MRIDELRLDELTGYRSNPIYQLFQNSADMDEFLEQLSAGGFDVKELGAGYYGAVFDKPGSKDVFKIFTADDKGYTMFLDYAKRNQHNPHVPRIYGGIMKVKGPRGPESGHGHDWIIVRMEKLSERGPKEIGVDVLQQYLKAQPTYNNRRPSVYDLIMSKNKVAEFEAKFPQLAEVLQWVAANGNRNGITIDLHGDNFMFRGNTVVITDPFSYFP